MAAFASTADLASYLQQTFTADETATASLLLDLATAAVVRACRGQQISYVANDTVTLRGAYSNRLRLPQRPVVDVTAVLIEDQAVSDYEWTGKDVLYRPYGWAFQPGISTPVQAVTGAILVNPEPRPYKVTVTYSHGYQTIPDDLRGVCVSVAARAFSNPRGLREEMIGSYREQYAGAGDVLVPGISLSVDEKRVCRDYAMAGREPE